MYQTYFNFIHENIVQNHGSVAYYSKLFSTLKFNIIPRRNNSIGRTGFDNHVMIKIAIIAIAEKLKTYPEHRRFLIDKPHLCEMIGLKLRGGKFNLPSDATLSKFYNSTDYCQLIKSLFINSIRSLLPFALNHYDYLCVDSQPILANTSLNNNKNYSKNKVSRDKDARWGVKGKSNDFRDKNPIFFYGYKYHAISIGSIPLAHIITPANEYDSSFLPSLLKQVMDNFSLCSLNVCADKGYDSNKNFDFIHDSFKGRAFISKRSFSLSSKTPTGKCDSLLKLHSTYLEKKRNILKTKFTCPLFNSKSNSTDCPFKDDLSVSSYGCTGYMNLSTGKYRDRSDSSSPNFKNVYRFRLNVENLFSIASDGRLNRVNGYSINYVNSKAYLFNLFVSASALLAISLNREDLLISTVKVKDLLAS